VNYIFRLDITACLDFTLPESICHTDELWFPIAYYRLQLLNLAAPRLQ